MCAICGERVALPDGNRSRVTQAWKTAVEVSAGKPLEPFFRVKQGRLCLVCATKRLYPHITGKKAHFLAFDAFHPDDDTSYVAVVSMDGDNLGTILGWPADRINGRDAEKFQRALSTALSKFASDLQGGTAPALNVKSLEPFLGGKPLSARGPQLIYAGGEDVLFVCDVRDALNLAQAICLKYRDICRTAVLPLLADVDDIGKFTISAGILLAHARQPAGLMLRDADHLLSAIAKDQSGRNALAVRLAKRSGAPVDVAVGWDEGKAPTFVQAIDETARAIRTGILASGPTFRLARETGVLKGVIESTEQWETWIADRLSRGSSPGEDARRLSKLLAPLFAAGKAEAMRIARFLGGEVAS
jgi:CRISPR/Cas system-associated protein Cas10 (large subunit of type III CRISPR-Cas system)